MRGYGHGAPSIVWWSRGDVTRCQSLTFKAWLNEPLASSLHANPSAHCCPMKLLQRRRKTNIFVHKKYYICRYGNEGWAKTPVKCLTTTSYRPAPITLHVAPKIITIILIKQAVNRLTDTNGLTRTLTNPALLGRVLAKAAATLTDNISSGC